MSRRHVAYVEARLVPVAGRGGRQLHLLAALSAKIRPLPDDDLPGLLDHPAAAFAFPTSVSGSEARARLEAALDEVDADWRELLKVTDGFPG